jgi:plastocyanin
MVKVLRILSVVLLVVILALVAGCGGDDDDEETTPAQTTTQPTEPAGGAETTTVGMDEYEYEPSDVTVKKGATITVENNGNIAHNLTVEKGPDPKEKSEKLAGTSQFLGGKSEELEVDLAPGKYAMVCTVPGHRELGMVGTFTVE